MERNSDSEELAEENEALIEQIESEDDSYLVDKNVLNLIMFWAKLTLF